jgi:hypothetical protein
MPKVAITTEKQAAIIVIGGQPPIQMLLDRLPNRADASSPIVAKLALRAPHPCVLAIPDMVGTWIVMAMGWVANDDVAALRHRMMLIRLCKAAPLEGLSA